MQKTNIGYLDYTWNPTHGCSPISEGCDNCWAERMSKRLAGMGAHGYSKDDPFKVMMCPEKLDEPLHVKKPSRIGVSFMGDLFHDDIKWEYIRKVLDIVFNCLHHKFLMLTKRPERAKQIFEKIHTENKVIGFPNLFYNLWLGASVENQKAADERIPILLQIPAAKRFVSVEPMLGPVDLQNISVSGGRVLNALRGLSAPAYRHEASLSRSEICEAKGKLDLVICGGETGPGARPVHVAWARKLRDDCQAAGVAFWFKGFGDWHRKRFNPPLGKEISRHLDSNVWEEWPE